MQTLHFFCHHQNSAGSDFEAKKFWLKVLLKLVGILGLFGQQYTNCGYIIWVPKVREKFFLKVNIDILCKCFLFLAYQRSAQLLYETLYTSIEALTALVALSL